MNEAEETARLGRDSHSLLQNYMLRSFFEKQEQESFELFSKLPDNASLDEFRVLLHKLKAVHNLKEMLENHVKNFQEMEIKILSDREKTINNI